MLMLLLLFFSALLLLVSLSSFFFLGTCPRIPHVLLSVLVSRLSPAPWLVSTRCSVSHGSAPMRLVGMTSFEGFACAHLCPITAISSLLSRIAGRFISQSLTLLLVGRAGWMHLQRRQTHLPAPPARTAPLRSSPSSALPEDSSRGSRERKNPFQGFLIRYYVMYIYK